MSAMDEEVAAILICVFAMFLLGICAGYFAARDDVRKQAVAHQCATYSGEDAEFTWNTK